MKFTMMSCYGAIVIASILKLLIASSNVQSFSIRQSRCTPKNKVVKPNHQNVLSMTMFDFASSNGSNAKIPVSIKDRDDQAISGIKSAIKKYKLVECEFPPLGSLNKLGDGSLRSALEVEEVCSQKLEHKYD